MGIETLVSVGEYRNAAYSPDCHFIAGRLVERDVGEKEHGRMQRALLRHMARYRDAGLEAWPEQRVQITPEHYSVVDVCITIGEPDEQIFSIPPLVCIEILSRKDTLSDVQEVIDDYVKLGVPYNWIINLWKRTAYAASITGFVRVPDGVFRTTCSHPELVIPLEELYRFKA